MSTESILSIISSVIALVTAGILIQLIKYQKGIIDSMKAYLGVFSVDEVKKYVELHKENMKMEHERAMEELKNEMRRDQIKMQELNKKMQREFLDNSHQLNEEFLERMHRIMEEYQKLSSMTQHDWINSIHAFEKLANQVRLDIKEELKKSRTENE